MRLYRLREQRGSILLFVTVLVVPLMIVIAGLAMDLAYYGTVDDELQRAMDASALAGAGKLGFDGSAFAGARQAAQDYATRNPYRAENAAKQITTSTFTQNDNNADPVNGNVILGIWNGTTRAFTPWASPADDPFVNAVKCQYASTIPTSFLKLIGLTRLSTAAQATAISAPPTSLCPGCCPFAIGVTQCPFETGGNMGSQGCGQPVLWASSTPVNTAAWINTQGTGTPSASETRNAITAAGTGASCNSTLQSGSQTTAQNGVDESAFKLIADCSGQKCNNSPQGVYQPGTGYFVDKFKSGVVYTTRDSNGNITYQGQGWQVYVPVIKTSCPPGPFTGPYQILTFSRLVITQVIDHGRCAVKNGWPGNIWEEQCPPPNGTCDTCSGGGDAIFGYFSCATMDAQPTSIPAPRAALATKLKLVR